MRRTLLILTSLVAALVAVSPATAATTKTVSIKRAAFSPATVNIIAGDSIRWRNDDTQNHQVVSTTGAFASPVLSRGKTYTFRFDVAGTYQYRNALHPSVTGTIKVAGPPPAVTLARLAAADRLRRQGDAHRPGQQQEGRRERAAQLPALRPGVGDRPGDRDHRRRRDVLVRRRAEDPHQLPRQVEDRLEPRDQHGRGARRSPSDATTGSSRASTPAAAWRGSRSSSSGSPPSGSGSRSSASSSISTPAPASRRRSPVGRTVLRIAMSVNQSGAGYLGAFSRETTWRRAC